LIEIIDNLIPANVGFDVKDISYAVDLTKEFNLEDDLLIDLEMQVLDMANSKTLFKCDNVIRSFLH
jgi:hypothetical protein